MWLLLRRQKYIKSSEWTLWCLQSIFLLRCLHLTLLFLIIVNIVLQDDGYIPKHSVLELQKAWPGSEVRWVTGGHVSSFILHNDEFRRAIKDGLDRLPWKESQL